MKSENLLKNIYIGLLALLSGTMVFTPLLIKDGVSIFSEEMIETGILFLLVVTSFAVYSLYSRELKRRGKELDETLNYIGAVNIQTDQLKSIFDMLTRYPESKKDFKHLFESLAQKALASVNSEWVLFRIVDTNSGNTLTEYTRARGAAVLLKCEVSNKDLLENKNPEDCQTMVSTQENLSIRVFCVLPVKFLSENQKVFLRAVVNNLSMLYLIFESEAVKKRK